MPFQTTIRYTQAAAIPGTIVEAADTYKYVRKGAVGKGKTLGIGKFAVYDAAAKGYRNVAQGDTADNLAGLCVLDKYNTGEAVDYVYKDGQAVTILENGIMAVEVVFDKGDTDVITIDLDTADIYVGTVTATITNKITANGFKCVQHTGLAANEKGIVFIKK